MIAAVAQRQQPNGTKYLKPFTSLIHGWAEFVVSQLPLPPLQRCTDDFEGPTANNTNLALKGIISLEAYGILISMMDEESRVKDLHVLIEQFSNIWIKDARTLSGLLQHYDREYQLPDTYSIKYNLIYQTILNVTVFPDSLIQTELFYYATAHSDKFGVSMDDRHAFTLTEYQGVLVSMAAPGSLMREQFVDQLFLFVNNTLPRYPLSDFYFTTNASNPSSAFTARPTLGDFFGVFMAN